MIKKMIGVIAAVFMSLGVCCGCGDKAEPLPYNAVIVASGNALPFSSIVPQGNIYLTDDFWKENLICVAYTNDHWDPTDPESKQIISYPDMPYDRTVIITSKEEYDHNFKKQTQVDFDREILLVYMDKTSVSSPTIAIKNVKFEGETLTLEYGIESLSKPKPGYNNATQPTRVWTAVKMDKLDFITANFVYKR